VTGRRVLLVRPDNVGDVLLTGPAVRAVARHAEVVFLTSPQGAEAASLLPGVHAVVTAHIPWIDAHPRPVDGPVVHRLERRLAAFDAERACIFTSSHQSPLPTALVLRMAGVGHITGISLDYPGSLLDVRIPGDPDLHEVERNLAVVRAAGFDLGPGDDGSLRIERASVAAPAAASQVVVHPGASVPARTWPPDRWKAVVQALAERGASVVVTGSAAEAAVVELVAGRSRVRTVVGASLAELAGVLEAARVVVSGNTGPAHLAAAVGTPVVVLFAPTVPPNRWHPWRVRHELLGHLDVACAGCRSRHCPVPGHPCLDVSVGDVVDAVERVATPVASMVTA
jgi:ADP-heptose:LPS heptosyltransferase